MKPVVRIGKSGITDTLTQEIDSILDSQELIKVKLNQNAVDGESSAMGILAKRIPDMEHVCTIGHTILLFRRSRTQPTKFPFT